MGKFNVGDRIQALDGVCPGAYGTIVRFDRGYPDNDTIVVVYDNEREDYIYGRMLALVDSYEYDIDEE